MSVSFFGRTTDKFANTFARFFAVALLIGARAFRRVFRHGLQRLFALLLRQGSVFAGVRYYFDLLRLFAVCLLNIYLLMTDVRFLIGE